MKPTKLIDMQILYTKKHQIIFIHTIFSHVNNCIDEQMIKRSYKVMELQKIFVINCHQNLITCRSGKKGSREILNVWDARQTSSLEIGKNFCVEPYQSKNFYCQHFHSQGYMLQLIFIPIDLDAARNPARLRHVPGNSARTGSERQIHLARFSCRDDGLFEFRV